MEIYTENGVFSFNLRVGIKCSLRLREQSLAHNEIQTRDTAKLQYQSMPVHAEFISD